MEYRYHLLKYAGKTSRLSCPNCGKPHCFTPYVDEQNEILDASVGRCDHEGSCGYHKSPGDWFKEHPDLKPGAPDWREAPEWMKAKKCPVKPGMTPDIIPWDIVSRSVRLDRESNLITFLRTLFDEETIQRLASEYYLGVTKDKAAIFFQVDQQGRCRGGKIIQYNPGTGHRIKDNDARIPVDWIHPRLKKAGVIPESWTMSQCLFGEHLLPRYPDRIVALVEAEKTALIGAGFVPEYVWLATGGRSGVNDRVDVLEGRKVLVFPDVDAFDYWTEKFKARPRLEVLVSDYLQKNASEQDLNDHIDIADWLVRWKTAPETFVSLPETPIQSIQQAREELTLAEMRQYLSPETVAAATLLVEELGLQLVSITYNKTDEMKLKILIDNGHGVETLGKRSPDGNFREYLYNREIAGAVVDHLKYRGYDAELLVPEVNDVSLNERCRRVNEICHKTGHKNLILVSVHVNAAGNGAEWMNARGWCCYTSKGNTAADSLATSICEAAVKYLPGHKMRFDHTDGDPDQERDFLILRNTTCPAVLTENLFMDNKEDVAFLKSDEGRKAIISLHVEGICNYLKSLKNS